MPKYLYLILCTVLYYSCYVNPFILDENDLDIRSYYDRDYLLVYLTSVPFSSASENFAVGKEHLDTVYADCYVVERYVTKKTNQSHQWGQKLALEDGWINIDTTTLIPSKLKNQITRIAFTSNQNSYIKSLNQLYSNGQLLLLINFDLDPNNYRFIASEVNTFNPSLLDSLEPALNYKVISD